jgi:hypothetical protein
MTRTTRKTMKGLAVLGLAVLGLLLSGPSRAQTAIRCSTAADVLRASERDVEDMRLRYSQTDIFAVNEIVLKSVGLAYLGVADTVQVFSLGAGEYILMASVQGCHVAHDFVDETFVLGLKGLYPDLSHLARSPGATASM